jgi:TatD DNase family protein
VRDAHQDALEILQKYTPKAVLHCFSGDESYLKAALDLGCYISFAGNLTFANAKPLRESLKLVPQSRLLFETDAPFLNPQRGQWPNTPANVVQVYKLAASMLGVSVDQLGQQVVANSQRLFNIE